MVFEENLKGLKRLSSLLRIALTAMLVLFANACATSRQPALARSEQRQSAETVVFTVHETDTVLRIVPDTALLEAYLRCDSNGTVLMDELSLLQGKYAAFRGVSLKATTGGQFRLTAEAVIDSLKTEIRIRDETIAALSNNNVRVKEKPRPSSNMSLWAVLALLILLITILTIKRIRNAISGSKC